MEQRPFPRPREVFVRWLSPLYAPPPGFRHSGCLWPGILQLWHMISSRAVGLLEDQPCEFPGTLRFRAKNAESIL